MSDLVQETDHVQVALDHLLHQFKDATALNEFFAAVLTPLQTTENDLWALYTERWPDVAVGAQLDNLGAIVGQPRQGRTDDVYRLWIQARILVNRSTGLGDDALRLLDLIAGSAVYELTEQFPAGYLVTLTDLNVDAEAIFDLLRLAKPAGVRLQMTYSEFPAADLFRYDVGPGYDNGRYAGNIDGS